MRLGRKLAEGIAVDREAERLTAEREPTERVRTAPVVTAGIAEDVPLEPPVRA
jgi:hypothetical protein